MKRLAQICALLSLLGPLTALAVEDKNLVRVSSYFLMPTWLADELEDPPHPQLSLQFEKSPVVVDGLWGRIGKPALAPRQREWKVQVALGDGSPARDLAVQVPPESDSVLLVVIPSRNNQFVVLAVDGRVGKFPPGNVYFVNVANEPAAISAGTETKNLAVREMWRVPASAATDFQIKTSISAQVNGQWRLVYRRTIFVDPQKRYIFLVHRQGLEARAWSTTLLDFSPPPEKPPLRSTEEES